MFQINEGPNDRRTRAIIGLAVLILSAFLLTGWIQIVASLVGIILIFTAITGYCALYQVLRISTKKKKEDQGENQ